MTPGQRIRYERENMGLAQEELAEKIGCSPQQVKRWEKDEAFPQPAWRRKLSTQFGKSIEELGLTPREKKSSPLPETLSEQTTNRHALSDTISRPLAESTNRDVQQTNSDFSQQRFPRRTILAGAGLVAIAGGAGTWWLVSHVGTSPASRPSNSLTKDAYKTYDIRSGDTVYPVYNVAWSPDGMYVAGATDDLNVKVWDVAHDKQLQISEPMEKAIIGVAWSPDGKRLAGAGNDTTVKIWDIATGNRVLSYTKHTRAVDAVSWSPDGNYIASAGKDKQVQVWDAATGKTIFIYKKHNDTIWTATWSHDSKRIASGGKDGIVQVWDATTGAHILTYSDHSQDVYDVEWSPNDELIASAGADKTVRVWHATTGETLYIYQGHSTAVHGVSWSPDGKRLASGGGDPNASPEGNTFAIQTWDAKTGKNVHRYKGHTMTIYAVAWSPNGSFIASGSGDDTIRIWSAT